MSRFDTPQIVAGSGRHRLGIWLGLLGLAISLALLWHAYDYGRQNAGFDAAQSEAELAAANTRSAQLLEELEVLTQKATRLERAAQIDRAAVEETQAQLRELQQERADLQQEVDFLKTLVSGDTTMLQINEVALKSIKGDRRYQFKFTLSKRAKGSARVKGRVLIAVKGQQQGADKTLETKALGIDEKTLKMGFSHFQNFVGQLRLPKDFIPETLVISVKAKSRLFKDFDQEVAWQLD